MCYSPPREAKEEESSLECNGEDDAKGIRKRKAKLPLMEEPRENEEKKESPDETVSMITDPLLQGLQRELCSEWQWQ